MIPWTSSPAPQMLSNFPRPGEEALTFHDGNNKAFREMNENILLQCWYNPLFAFITFFSWARGIQEQRDEKEEK